MGRQSLLPVEASDKEVQVAQDLGAVHEPINVARVHSLVAASRACPLTGCQHKTVSALGSGSPQREGWIQGCLPFGHNPPQGSHILSPFLSTSILSGGQALTQDV